MDTLPAVKARALPLPAGITLRQSDMTPPKPPRDDHWAVLAGLRFALATIVVLTHLSIHGQPQWERFVAPVAQLNAAVAVMCFLFVSGYSIAASVERDREHFAQRRLWRIWPTYITAFGLTMSVFAFFGPVFSPGTWGPIAAPVGKMGEIECLLNMLCLQFIVTFPCVPFLQSWSLAVEVFWYAWAPRLWKLSPKPLYALAVGCGIAYLAHPLYSSKPYIGDLYFQTQIYYGWAWLAGFIFYRNRQSTSTWTCCTIGMMIVGLSAQNPPELGGLTLAGSMLLFHPSFRLQLTAKRAATLLFLGELSYPLYMVQNAVIVTCDMVLHVPDWIGAAMVYMLAVALSAAIYLAIDKPLRTYVKRTHGKQYATASGAA
jgi:peptidoglycan/LPS O-acetylase OafA/YrhL